MLGDYWIPNREKVVTTLYNRFLISSMEFGYNIVIDNMNLNPKTCKYLEDLIKSFNSDPIYETFPKYEIEYKDFFISVDECIRRDAMRPNPIGEKVIKETWRRYRTFILTESVKKHVESLKPFSLGLPRAIIVDMDATLCFNTSGRPFYGKGAAEGMLEDVPNSGVCELVKSLYAEDYKVLIVTGREGTEEIVEATKGWLAKWDIEYDEAFFRPKGNYDAGDLCKRDIYEKNIKDKYNISFVLEDNQKCVKMWRELGLTCLQPNDGTF